MNEPILGRRLSAQIALLRAASIDALNRTWQTKKTAACLLAILAGAFLVRAAWVGSGYPYIYGSDEPTVMGQAIKIMQTGNFEPADFRYPSLLMYMELR